MKYKNRYVKYAKIFEAKFRQLVRNFANDVDALTIASLIHLNRNTVNIYLILIRRRIAEFCEQQSPFKSEIKIEESCLDGNNIKGKGGRSKYKKTPVFYILKRGGKIYIEIVPDRAKATPKGIIKDCIHPDSITHSIGWNDYKNYYRANNESEEFINHKSHKNDIKSFLLYAKHRLEKFHGIADSTLY